MKKCKKCNTLKEDLYFYTKRNICKECISLQNKEYHSNHKQKISQRKKSWRKENIEKIRKFEKEHQEQSRKRSIEYYRNNKKQIYLKRRNNLQRKINENQYVKLKYKEITSFRILMLFRNRIRNSLKGRVKFLNCNNLLGCSIEFLKEHLQQTAINNGYLDFDINQYSGRKYHIDHIKPCSSFDLSKEDEQKECFHWSNLQILDSHTNLKKSNLLTINTDKESSDE